MKTKHLLTCAVALLTVLTVRAELFGFDTVTTNSPNREAIADQLFMETTGLSSLLFSNTGSADSAITEIYFGSDLTTLNLNIDSIISSSSGVNFTIDGANPQSPPGWEEFANWWSVTIAAAESEPPPAQNGINPYEYLELGLSYTSGTSLAELIQSGDVQVALHVTGLGNGGEFSDTFVNDTTVVPEPASLALLLGTSSMIVFVRRRFIA